MDVSILPSVNAALNGIAAILLIVGFVLIRRRKIGAHRAVMIAAFCCSVLFLASYLVYHFHAGSTRFPGSGGVRALYLTILATHTVLAAVVPFLAVITLLRAVKGRYEHHARVARRTLPVWLYVSATGVIIYWMLYRMAW